MNSQGRWSVPAWFFWLALVISLTVGALALVYSASVAASRASPGGAQLVVLPSPSQERKTATIEPSPTTKLARIPYLLIAHLLQPNQSPHQHANWCGHTCLFIGHPSDRSIVIMNVNTSLMAMCGNPGSVKDWHARRNTPSERFSW